MIHDVSRLDYIVIHSTEDDLRTMEDDRIMMEDDQNFHLQNNNASLKPF